MSSIHEHDPASDAELRSAMLRAEEDAEWTAERAARLRQGVMARAELPLARRRRAVVRGRLRTLSRPLVPLAAAAALAGVLLLGPRMVGTGHSDPEGLHFPAALRPAVEEVLGTRISEEEFRLFTGGADAELLLTAAVDLN